MCNAYLILSPCPHTGEHMHKNSVRILTETMVREVEFAHQFTGKIGIKLPKKARNLVLLFDVQCERGENRTDIYSEADGDSQGIVFNPTCDHGA